MYYLLILSWKTNYLKRNGNQVLKNVSKDGSTKHDLKKSFKTTLIRFFSH